MSRRPSRAANAQKRAQSRELRAKRAAERKNSCVGITAPKSGNSSATRSSGANAVREDRTRNRLWTALLVGGAAVAFGLLGREIADAYADRARPTFLQNDLYSALTSVAILALVGFFAYNRWRMQRKDDRS